MSFLSPNELADIEHDVVAMFDSAEMTPVELRWREYVGDADGVYEDHPDEAGTLRKLTVNCQVLPVRRKDMEEADWGRYIEGDVILVFQSDVVLEHDGLEVVAADGTTWVPDQDPPDVSSRYAEEWLGNATLTQVVYGRLKK